MNNQHGFPFTRYFEDNACPHCEAGEVHLRIGTEHVETIKCDTCSGFGFLVPSERAKVMSGVESLNYELSKVHL
jgi:hypothetical protein